MKVLQIGLGNNPGGVETFAMNYYRKLSQQGVQFDFVCMYSTMAYEEEAEQLGGKVFHVPNVKKNYFGYVKALKRILQTGDYDAVHVHMLSAANIVPLRLASRMGIRKVIAHSHNTSTPGLLRKVMNGWNKRKLLRYANCMLACGREAGEWLFGKKEFEHGTVVNNAIDVERYLYSDEKRRQIRTEMKWEDKFVVGHVGRFELQKNHEKLIDIFAEIAEREESVVLCLIGDGALRPQIENKIAGMGLADRVFLLGRKDNVDAYLSAMDSFLFPSFFEGLPFTLLEAQAGGLPCVVSDTITKDAFLSKEQVAALPLEEEDGIWADAVLKYQSWNRPEPDELRVLFQKAQLDIVNEAEQLKRLYQE